MCSVVNEITVCCFHLHFTETGCSFGAGKIVICRNNPAGIFYYLPADLLASDTEFPAQKKKSGRFKSNNCLLSSGQ